jgi:hypothetical protein|tara:strand:+ start:95746 stop:96006 length:261 start_codon:yes stop_codon:yes gene_type:complete
MHAGYLIKAVKGENLPVFPAGEYPARDIFDATKGGPAEGGQMQYAALDSATQSPPLRTRIYSIEQEETWNTARTNTASSAPSAAMA